MTIIIKAHNEDKKDMYIHSVMTAYETAALTASFIGSSFNGKSIPSFDEIYPHLLSEEERERRRKTEMESYRAQWEAFMITHNKLRKEN